MSKVYPKIKDFILKNVENHPADLVACLSKKFSFSRQRAHFYITKEIKNGNIIKTGSTRSTRYFLVGGDYIQFNVKIETDTAEDQIWSKYIKPMLLSYSRNVQNICSYGFTEIFNNAIDHSEGKSIYADL